MKKRKRKRRKKSRYITGIYDSEKATKRIRYRSSWEYYVCRFLDEQLDVVSYEYESIKIPYISNIKSKKTRNYIPDFLVNYVDGSQKIIEVKRKTAINNSIVVKKAEAARKWCESLAKEGKPITYEMWTEAIIFPIRQRFLILEKIQKQQKKKKTRKKISV